VAATGSPETAQAFSEARKTATNATSEASTMRQMELRARFRREVAYCSFWASLLQGSLMATGSCPQHA
jgi:hypothetical protein